MDFTQTSTLLESAVLALAGPGQIKDRLARAYSEFLVNLNSEQMPSHLALQFLRMVNQLGGASGKRDSASIRTAALKLSNDEAHHFSALIVRLCMETLTSYPPAVAATPALSVVPQLSFDLEPRRVNQA